MPALIRVEGLRELQQALKDAENGSLRAMRKELRSVLGPIVVDARARFSALPGTGPRTAQTVKGFVRPGGIGVQFGSAGRGPGKGFEYGREFGARHVHVSTFQQNRPTGPVLVTRTIDYTAPSMFGPWTGNRFTLFGAGQVSGRAFNPAVQAGARLATHKIDKVLDGYARRVLTATD